MKIQTKITLVFSAIATIGLVVINAAIFYFVSEFSFDDFFKRLEARVNLTAETKIHPDSNSAAYQEVRNRYLEKLEKEQEYIVQLDRDKQFKKPLPLPAFFYNTILKKGKARYSRGNHFYAGRYFNMGQGQYIVIVAAEDPYGFKELQELKRVLLVIFVIAIILTYVSGKIFSYYTVKPVRGIIKRVQNITANNLHQRLPETKGKDELAEMVHTFNDMLNRLETAFETQNNFVSNASHELRTPLTILTSETELLKSTTGLSEAAKDSANAILSQAEKLEHILSSLLGLAQSGFNGKKQNWEVIRIDELVLHVANAVKKIEPEGVIDLNFDELPDDEHLLQTLGNVNLLQLALSNIVLNACKYSNNSPVEIKISVENSRIVIGVTDKGIGIPDEEQQHIFEPFFRASNTGEFEGHGIGLPLTLNIIRLHKGTIGIRSEEEIGTEIQILLPVHSN
ncbi:MAG: HAMP domain-containing histidine kinase [Chryseobacterium sp.]|nr:MAG: HAMP domain-containing histidine kinase [Chryseobacterium sp.]